MMLHIRKKDKPWLTLKQQLVLNFLIIIAFEEMHPYAYRYTNRKIVIGTWILVEQRYFVACVL